LPRNLKPRSLTLVGAGKVGTALSALLQGRGYRIISLITRNPSRARSFARFVECPTVSKSISDVSPGTDLLIIAVPDEEISGVASQIARSGLSFLDRVTAFHVSGSITSDALSPLAACGARTFSLHPIQTFAAGTRLRDQMAGMKGIWYGFEGEKNTRPFARSLVRDLGGRFLMVPKEQKNLYHVACVFASNYPVALIGAVEALAARLRMNGTGAFRPLIETAIRQAMDRGAAGVLTGPVSRGSSTIVRQHLDALGREVPALSELYSALGIFALKLAEQRGNLSGDQIKELKSLLSKRP